ncbi:MAG: hypothetical protein K2G16_11335, partial [Lachnospiraceae bacterium]|nr:hypothetical protein [Lachnospiraceae bacterium]
CVGEDGSIRERSGEDVILTNHGSTVANIILQYAPDTFFCSIRIFFDDTLSATHRQLAAGLNWCFEQRVPVVHLSAGTKSMADYDSIRPVVARMVLQGQILVAAHSNSEGYCMPAGLSGGFCVRADASMTGFSYAADTRENGMAFRASSRHGKLCGEETVFANIYAAPTVTAAVCLHYGEYSSVRNCGQALYRKLTGREPCYWTPDFAENVVVVNRSGVALTEAAFFFSQSREHAIAVCDGADKRNDSEKNLKKVLVWIPGKKDVGSEENLLVQAADRDDVAGVVYCGTLSQEVGIRLREHLVWDETRRPKTELEWQESEGQEVLSGLKGGNVRGQEVASRLEEEDAEEPVMLPLVMLLGERSEVIRFAAALRKLFLQEKYSCVCVSDIPMSYLYGMFDVSSGIFGNIELEMVRKNFHPDLVFCCSEHWMKGIGADHYFVIDLSSVCREEGIIVNLDFSTVNSVNPVEAAKERILTYTWPD